MNTITSIALAVFTFVVFIGILSDRQNASAIHADLKAIRNRSEKRVQERAQRAVGFDERPDKPVGQRNET